MLLYMLGPPLPVPRNQAGALQKSDYSTWVYSYAVLTLAAPSSTFYTTASLFFSFLFPSSLFISSRFGSLFLGCDGCPRRRLTFVP